MVCWVVPAQYEEGLDGQGGAGTADALLLLAGTEFGTTVDACTVVEYIRDKTAGLELDTGTTLEEDGELEGLAELVEVTMIIVEV